MSDLAELLERVKAFNGNDDLLEGDIFGALIGVDAIDAKEWYGGGISILASVERAFELVDRVALDLVIRMTRIGDGSGELQIEEVWFADSGVEVIDPFNPLLPAQPALAILAALLSALIAQEPPAMTMPDTLKPDELVSRLNAAYAKVAEWPEREMRDEAVEDLGVGFNNLLELRNLVPEAADRLSALQSDLERVTAECSGWKSLAMSAPQNAVVNATWEVLGGQDATREGGQSLVGRVTELRTRALTAEAALVKARAALEPFANAVFNDNGDMTVQMGTVKFDDFVRRLGSPFRPEPSPTAQGSCLLRELGQLPSHPHPNNRQSKNADRYPYP